MKKKINILLHCTMMLVCAATTASYGSYSSADIEENLRYMPIEELHKLNLQWGPEGFLGWDGCRARKDECKCSDSGKKGVCEYGKDKKGLYCQCP